MIASKHYCRFVGCTCIMRLSYSTTPHRCSIGLRVGYCGGYLNTVDPLHVQISVDLSFVTWSIVLLGLAVRRWVQCIHKRMDMVSANTIGRLWYLNNAHFGTKRLKIFRENNPHTITSPPPT